MPSVLQKLKEKISPSAAREAARVRSKVESLEFYRDCVNCAARGQDYDATECGEKMAALDLTDLHWNSDVEVFRDYDGEGEFEKTYDTKLAELTKFATEYPKSEMRGVPVWLAVELYRRNANPRRATTTLEIPKVLLEAAGKMADCRYQIQSLYNRKAVLERFKRCNPRMFAEPIEALKYKTAGVRLSRADHDRENELVSRNSGLFIDKIQ